MLKHRIGSGVLMAVFFGGMTVLDGWLDGSATVTAADDKPIQGTLLAILLVLVLGLAVVEFSRLVASKDLVVVLPAAVVGVVLVSTTWYWPQVLGVEPHVYLLLSLALSLLGAMVGHYRRCGVGGALANCGATSLAVAYLGGLGAFVLAVRVEFGLWQVLMLMCVVKASDIGAYTFGKLFGKHKFSPRVSPGKTWEGLAGAMGVALGVSLAFAALFGTMSWWQAMIFGPAFAVIGQMGDLAESMMKRDAGQKDSSNRVPGFGGILDVIDSPLVAAPFGYLFFRLVALGG
ncbi:MAG: phosphatidate cytidylyltransferase [Phycisphaerales bacterium]|nr:MAG: phosphatidate cytidylyltransferase [Phycisphaerales bacterium]